MNAIWNGMDQATLDREYNARATVADFPAEMRQYAEMSAAARASLAIEGGLVFDEASGNALDWFPGRPGGPVLLWVHGGFWRALGRTDNSCVAPGLVAAGAHVAVMDYTLAPDATLDEIVRQTRAACHWVAAHAVDHGADPALLFVGGSSAGGHLAAMLISEGWAAPPIRGAVLFSGLFDLEPVRLSYVNEWLSLDSEAAQRLSPLRNIPRRGAAPPLFACYGGNETSEFKRQTEEYANAWAARGHEANVVPRPERNHFDLAVAVGDPDDPLCQAVAAFMGLAHAEGTGEEQAATSP